MHCGPGSAGVLSIKKIVLQSVLQAESGRLCPERSWDRVPYPSILRGEVLGGQGWLPRLGVVLCVWDEVVVLDCVACLVVVDLGGEGVVMVVLWSVGFVLRVDMRMHFKADSECVQVAEVEDFEFCHDWLVRSRWLVFEEPDDFFLCSDEPLDV